ncbi:MULTISPECIES: malonate decarboxylase holo-ACP synthase [Cupriavidus]|uniref:Malonate decarboxylase holo-ACP synthase n=1 Tax=Cupriavidus campinensis TaxID=151783 RepID=A0AAE9I370_9BURK|nr:malonate decarboxylase holo-ACP synthase [Cupriavidus campinensis]URF06903.1 malonate decarboxylase holo-ACP synthase [Cupriavidus campinensis]
MPDAPLPRPLQPHDLIWLRDAPAFAASQPLPAWVDATWLAVAPVVVRRDLPCDPTCDPTCDLTCDLTCDSSIPVGLRGRRREERHGTWIEASQCARVMSPFAIARAARWQDHPRRLALPALRTLARIAPLLDARGLPWGVTGAAGFTLASGLDVLHPGSDVDLLIDAAAPLDQADEQWLAALIDDCTEARLDIQVATPHGGFALLERLRTGGRVLLKTATGPVRCADPWQAA